MLQQVYHQSRCKRQATDRQTGGLRLVLQRMDTTVGEGRVPLQQAEESHAPSPAMHVARCPEPGPVRQPPNRDLTTLEAFTDISPHAS